MRHQIRGWRVDVVRELRQGQTEAERFLWSRLRDRRFEDVKFRRQHRIGSFVVDFYAPSHRLAIELDGEHHLEAGPRAYDGERTRRLASLGIHVLRFTNDVVLVNPAAVLDAIREAISTAF